MLLYVMLLYVSMLLRCVTAYDGLREPYIFPEAEAPRGTRGVEERLACPAQPGWQ